MICICDTILSKFTPINKLFIVIRYFKYAKDLHKKEIL